MAFLAAALPALADLGATGAAAGAGTGVAAGAGATAALAGGSADAAGADALSSVLGMGAVPSAGDLLASSGILGTSGTGLAIGSLLNSLPSSDTLKTFASGSGTDISDIIKSFLGQQEAAPPGKPPMNVPKKGGGQGISVPPLIAAQSPNPSSVMSKAGGLSSSVGPTLTPQMLQQLISLLSSGKQSGISI